METKSTEQNETRDNLFSHFFNNDKLTPSPQNTAVQGGSVVHKTSVSGHVTIAIPNSLKWIQDKSGMYCLIAYNRKEKAVRVDIMSTDNEPVRSVEGSPRDVYKQIARTFGRLFSAEHMAYIGYEISVCWQASFAGTKYTQG